MDKEKITFEVETKESGQRHAYGDTHRHYIVSSTQSVEAIKAFCVHVLEPAVTQEERKKLIAADFGGNFATYWTTLDVLNEVSIFEDGKNIVEYKAVQPSTC